LDIPIGLINTSWGGTNIETWISVQSIRQFPQYEQQVKELLSPSFSERFRRNIYNEFVNDPGLKQEWYKSGKEVSGWKKTTVPSLWSKTGIKGPGVCWYRREFTLTAQQAKSPVTIVLGSIDDNDETYLNGEKIGETIGHSTLREYTITKGLREGINELTVRVIDSGGEGGFSAKTEDVFCRTAAEIIPLAGEWDCRVSIMVAAVTGPNEYPSLRYNAMIAPLVHYPVKGAIWYQGESNAGNAYRYRSLLPAMITDWRNAWKQADMPFYFVRLANFTAPAEQPGESNWAELRESQHLTLQTPGTGEAVAIDIGDAADSHPKNKQDVGYRLALNALAKTYGKSVEYSGPEYRNMKIDGNRIILTFDHTAKGLVIRNKYGYLQGFAIAGADKKFVWAKARIEGNTVVVSSDEIKSPVAVRYAWGNNPDDANLYSTEGLPASPFRTDEWKVSTQE
jgi:sialate O-acetylesterase